jgi:ParB-like chromosome segregation protein Spo0J
MTSEEKNKHPVSAMRWVPASSVYANDYNPNSVAPPEMKLLELSIQSDGFTQPIVVWQTEQGYEVVDGFHRHLVGKKLGFDELPVVVINSNRTGKEDRIASTVRHNRARGKHSVDGMSDLVQELVRRNWSDAKIARELGMDADEVLRLKQITGLAEMFADREFSEAWEVC